MTDEELNELKQLKYECDDDNIRAKEIIVQELIKNNKLIHCLNNPKLDEESPDDYVGINIKKSAIYPEVQDIPQNYIGIAVNSEKSRQRNAKDIMSLVTVTFYVFCDERTLYDEETGLSRHDELAHIIKEIFSYTNKFGLVLTVNKDLEAITDTHYMTRTLSFTMQSPNNLSKNGGASRNYWSRKVE